MPRSRNVFAAAIPDEPAPMMHALRGVPLEDVMSLMLLI
jgi:hypothetical protein